MPDSPDRPTGPSTGEVTYGTATLHGAATAGEDGPVDGTSSTSTEPDGEE